MKVIKNKKGLSALHIDWYIGIDQGSQTRGPPDAFVRPASISKTENIVNFDQIQLILRAFLVNCGPQELFSDKLRPAKHCFFGMWPSHKFEFETPGIDNVCTTQFTLRI